jgi:ketosteroid isomerase-like protein
MAIDRAAVSAWIASYEAVWRSGRSEGLEALFTPGAAYGPTPSAPPLRGLAEIRAWWEAQTSPAERWRMEAEVVAVDGDRAVARLDVRYTAPAERRYQDLWLMRFAPDGRCAEFEEWYWSPEFDA